jgi:hypothetical protein
MSIESLNKSFAGAACALALLLAACDESNSNNEVCGNAVVDPGEDCDGTDLGAGTCMSEVQRGGTLRCNADCTFDVTECTLASCGNNVVEEGESCDGSDLGDRTCTSIGFVGGDIACSDDCDYDTSTCCTNSCTTDGAAECVGDTLRVCSAGPSGCLAWQVTDCTATNEVCDDTAAPTCVCLDRCTEGDTRCAGALIETCGETPAGCLDWMTTTDCSTANGVCTTAPTGPICALDVSAEDCSDPYVLSAGENAVAWTAANADYLTAPSCDSSLVGPDLVLSYTAPNDGFVRITMAKPTQRQVMVVSAAACGTVTPEEACASGTAATLSTELGVEMGTTYYVYVRDTSSGTAPIANPLFVTVEETSCATIATTPPTLSPANGTSIADRTPLLTVDLPYPIAPTAGIITISGTLGTNLVFDLATAPAAVSFINGNKTMLVDAGVVFPLGETVTVSWSGLLDASCGVAIPSPAWSFTTGGTSCVPGTNGMVGNTVTRVPTGLTSLTEQFVAADDDPNGYVYYGGASDLWRTPKAGGTRQDIEAAAMLDTGMLGNDMLIAGNEIYTLENTTTALVSTLLWRISSDGGATWNVENYMQLPMPPNDDLSAINHHEGRIYMITNDLSDGTEIWSVAAGATMLPQIAVLEATIPNEEADTCTGIAVDDAYFYIACSIGERLIRVDRGTLTTELLTDQINLGSSKNSLHVHDLDGNGRADILYVGRDSEDVRYVCDPAGTGPFFVDVLASFGSVTTTSNNGLGFDRVGNVLWMFDDDTRELVKIQ